MTIDIFKSIPQGGAACIGKCRSKGFGALPQQAFCNAKVAVVYTAALLATAVRRPGGEIVMRPFDVRHANSALKKLVSTLKELE